MEVKQNEMKGILTKSRNTPQETQPGDNPSCHIAQPSLIQDEPCQTFGDVVRILMEKAGVATCFYRENAVQKNTARSIQQLFEKDIMKNAEDKCRRVRRGKRWITVRDEPAVHKG